VRHFQVCSNERYTTRKPRFLVNIIRTKDLLGSILGSRLVCLLLDSVPFRADTPSCHQLDRLGYQTCAVSRQLVCCLREHTAIW
jgi:hypothetical protein